MSRTDRTADRARKAFAHAVSHRMDKAESDASQRAMRRAQRGERHARRAYLESLRYSDGFDALMGDA